MVTITLGICGTFSRFGQIIIFQYIFTFANFVNNTTMISTVYAYNSNIIKAKQHH